MIKNIIFDIGKVLIGFDWEAYLASLFDDETSEKVGNAIFRSGYWPELDKAVLSEDEILELFYSVSPDVKAEIKEAFDRIGECVEKRDWVTDMIDGLKERGYRVYYLSNMSEHVMNSNTDAFAFTSHMDGGVYSCHINCIKPDPEIYRILLRKYDLLPEECLFIDDHKENTSGAKRLGIKGLTFRDHDQLVKDLGQTLVKDATHDKVTVLCYGDSNTYGYDPSTQGRYPYAKRWTSILEEMLGGRYEVINEGLNGRTTAYDRPDASWKNGSRSLLSSLGTHKPVDILIIMLGTNDLSEQLGLTSEQIAEGMEELVTLAEENAPELQGYVPRIIVAAPADIGEDHADSPFADQLSAAAVIKSREIGPLYMELAARHECDFVSAIGAAEVSLLDSEHLSEKGHRQMAELMYNAITDQNM